MKRKATAYLIHGYLGSGKTTFAKQLEIEKRAMRFSNDEWMVKLFGTNPPQERFEECYDKIMDLSEEVWSKVLALGNDVVLDFGFWSRSLRDRVRSRIEGIGGDHVMYSLVCDEDLAWQRVEDRQQRSSETNLLIDDRAFKEMRRKFQSLNADETHITIKT